MSETSDDIAIRFEQGGHRAIALTAATCKGRATAVQPPLSAEEIAAILADYRATVARTAHEGGAEDFASLAAWLPALAARCAALEERVGVLTGALVAVEWGSEVTLLGADYSACPCCGALYSSDGGARHREPCLVGDALAATPPAQRAPAAATGEGE